MARPTFEVSILGTVSFLVGFCLLLLARQRAMAVLRSPIFSESWSVSNVIILALPSVVGSIFEPRLVRSQAPRSLVAAMGEGRRARESRRPLTADIFLGPARCASCQIEPVPAVKLSRARKATEQLEGARDQDFGCASASDCWAGHAGSNSSIMAC
jgi:hypothetical protein